MDGIPKLFVTASLVVLLAARITHGHFLPQRQSQSVDGKTREFYIAAVEREWDYAPSGMNKVTGVPLEQDRDAKVFVTKGETTIGKVYKKVLYREFTDDTFSTEKPHAQHLGFLGPVIFGEVGDMIKIHFKNKATRKYSVHPHGVFYKKNSEGALYEDHTSGDDKKDDHVPPGGTHTYEWPIKFNHAPTADDDECLTWVYHSHVDPAKDTNTGLVGPLLTCKKGTVDSTGKAISVDKQYIALFTVLDENMSWLLDKNIETYCTKPTNAKAQKADEGFKEANKMHGINGYLYGNLPGLEMCLGDKVGWHLFGIGNEVDIHTAYFHGQTFLVDSHRKDVASLLPATFITASMTTYNPGTWMLNCVVNDHYAAGMYALFNVTQCSGKTAAPPVLSGGKTRTYYIAAKEVIWDYGPSGNNNFKGGSLIASGSESEVFFKRGPQRIGGRYKKALFFEYTDDQFTTNKTKDDHLGFLGPVIRAEVGDTIRVVFKNMASRNYSIQPHGVFFNKSNEGALYRDFTSGKAKLDDIVRPNQTYVYTWSVPDHVGPTSTDAQCLTWAYYSSVDPVKDTYSGLIGPLLTCKKGSMKSDGQQTNINKEFVLLFTVTDESVSWYHEENKKMFCTAPCANVADEDYLESNKMHGINGYLYGNLNGLRMCKGDSVSWHLIGWGNEVDMHTAVFYGQTVLHNTMRKDTVNLLPGSFATVNMVPDDVGEWALVCKTTDHYSAGMLAKYKVDQCQSRESQRVEGVKRTYFIAAVERIWDYAPTGRDVLQGKALNESANAPTFTVQGPQRIGRKYKKALYREFVDAEFMEEKRRQTPAEQHLGVLGPIIYAEVGDRIEVHFKNLATFNYSVHPHGVFYSKSMEGSDYVDNSQSIDRKDNKVGPGKTYKYEWTVPDRAGPGPQGTNCITWAYYSDVNAVKDPNTGLIGPIVICRKNTLTASRKRSDVTRDFALLFTVMDENKSWYLDDNIKEYCPAASGIKEDADFKESNLMHGINGYVFGNLPGLEMTAGDKVDWYLLGMGNEVDMHTVHFHGQTFLTKSVSYHREDVYDLFPGVFATVSMIPDSVGTWMLHCHVNDHMNAGMETLFTVRARTKPPAGNVSRKQGSFILVLLCGVLKLLLSYLA